MAEEMLTNSSFVFMIATVKAAMRPMTAQRRVWVFLTSEEFLSPYKVPSLAKTVCRRKNWD